MAEQATPLLPGIRVPFLSGYTDDAMLRPGFRHGTAAFLEKPHSPLLVLAAKVREELDAGAAR